MKDGDNYNAIPVLWIGNDGLTAQKRSLVKFDIAASGIPTNAQVLNSRMTLYYSFRFSDLGNAGDRWVYPVRYLGF